MPKKPFEVIGLDEATRDMNKWSKEVGEEVDKQSRDLANQIADRVSNRVPVLTGTLSSSVEVVDVSGDEQGWGVAIGDGVVYAGWIEFGGSRGRALVPEGRYLYPTALEFEDEYGRLASDIAETSAERFPWSTPTH